MISEYNLLISYRKYFKDALDVPAHIRYHKAPPASDFPYITLDYADTMVDSITKGKDLMNERVYITVGLHSDTLAGLKTLSDDVEQRLRYESFPLLDDQGVVIGAFSVEGFGGKYEIRGGDYERESVHHRKYIETFTSITHLKQQQ